MGLAISKSTAKISVRQHRYCISCLVKPHWRVTQPIHQGWGCTVLRPTVGPPNLSRPKSSRFGPLWSWHGRTPGRKFDLTNPPVQQMWMTWMTWLIWTWEATSKPHYSSEHEKLAHQCEFMPAQPNGSIDETKYWSAHSRRIPRLYTELPKLNDHVQIFKNGIAGLRLNSGLPPSHHLFSTFPPPNLGKSQGPWNPVVPNQFDARRDPFRSSPRFPLALTTNVWQLIMRSPKVAGCRENNERSIWTTTLFAKLMIDY